MRLVYAPQISEYSWSTFPLRCDSSWAWRRNRFGGNSHCRGTTHSCATHLGCLCRPWRSGSLIGSRVAGLSYSLSWGRSHYQPSYGFSRDYLKWIIGLPDAPLTHWNVALIMCIWRRADSCMETGLSWRFSSESWPFSQGLGCHGCRKSLALVLACLFLLSIFTIINIFFTESWAIAFELLSFSAWFTIYSFICRFIYLSLHIFFAIYYFILTFHFIASIYLFKFPLFICLSH